MNSIEKHRTKLGHERESGNTERRKPNPNRWHAIVKKAMAISLFLVLLSGGFFPGVTSKASAAYTMVMTADEFIDSLNRAKARPTQYNNNYPYNVGYYNGSSISWDCWNLGKSIIWTRGAIVNNYSTGSYAHEDEISGLWVDADGDWIKNRCVSLEKDFSNIVPGEWLFYENGTPGHCTHMGYYIGNGKLIEIYYGNYVKEETLYSDGTATGSSPWAYHGKVPWIDYSAYTCVKENIPFNSIIKVKSGKNAWLKSMPVSGEANPNSINVVNAGIPAGTRMLATQKVKNIYDNYWYKVEITSGDYAGKKGYVLAELTEEVEHIHDKGTYKNTREAHPHYKCYQCSVCGTTWESKDEPTERDGCEFCFPAMYMGAGYTIPDGDYLIALASNSKWYVDIPGTEIPAAASSNVQLCGPLNSEPLKADIWTVTYLGGLGYYKILQKDTDMSLDVKGASTANGANIQVYPFNNSDAQKWSITQNTDGSYRIQPKCSGRSLDVDGAKISNGTNIQQWSPNDTLAQKWTFIPYSHSTYTVTYNANGGTGAPDPQTKTHNVALPLSNAIPSRADTSAGSYTVILDATDGIVSPASLSATRTISYSFKNWNTRQNGSGTSYNPGESYTVNETATLYAQWNSSTKTASVELPTPTREGYIFQGWATTADAASGVSGSYTPSSNVTLYAVWNNQWVVAFNGNGGEGLPALLVADGETAVIPKEIPVYNGQRFLGWSLALSAEQADYQPGDSITPTSNVMLNAMWEKVYESDWGDTKPAGVKDELIEVKTQYRYSIRDTKTSSSPLEGWTLTGKQQSWGDYGDWKWSTEAVAASDSTQVVPTTTYGWYYYTCPNCGAHMHGRGTNACYTWAGGCGASIPDNFHAEYLTVSWDNASDWYGTGAYYANIDGVRWFKWTDGGTQTQYRYRTRPQVTTYYYERWTEWSDWSDTPVEENDSVKVETRTLYRCVIGEDRTMTLPSSLTKIESEAFVGIAADAVVIPESVRSIADDAFDAGVVIIGKSNSYAQLYAGWNELAFIPVDSQNG